MLDVPTDSSYTDIVYFSVPIADGEDPEPSIDPYLKTVLSLAKVSEPLFKVIYVQRISVSYPTTSNIDRPPIFVSPALPSQLADISDSASDAAESLFFRVVGHLRTKNPKAWTSEGSGETSGAGDVFTELKVPMWPPLEGPEEGDW